MTERERQPEQMPEKKEYSFEEGADRAIQIIEELLKSQDFVVVGIAGPLLGDVNVGKTTLSSTIARKLYERGIPRFKTDRLNFFDEHNTKQLKREQQNQQSQKGVIIFGALTFGFPNYTEDQAENFKHSQDAQVQEIAQTNGLPFSKIDLRILIYRPDQEPAEYRCLIADIFIKNERAKIDNGPQNTSPNSV